MRTAMVVMTLVVACLIVPSRPAAGSSVATISTVAGGPGWGPALGVAQSPLAVAASGGTVYVLDVEPGVPGLGFSYSGTVRAIDTATGDERLVAGDGRVLGGYAGDGGPASAARFSQPLDVAVDPSGNVYVSDSGNNRIRKITPAGTITTIAGPTRGFSGDGGPASAAAIDLPTGLTVDGQGRLHFFDYYNRRVRRIDTDGTISTVAGNGTGGTGGDGGPATMAQLTDVRRMAFDAAGTLYLPDLAERRIRRVTAGGTMSTLISEFSTFAVAPAPTLGSVHAISGTAIVTVSAGGVVTTTAGSESTSGYVDGAAAAARFGGGRSIAAADGRLYVADLGNARVRRLHSGTVTTIAGNGAVHFGGDGRPAAQAQLHRPTDLAVRADGAYAFVDQQNHRVRLVDSAGVITTVAGNGEEGFSGDGGPATAARFAYPAGLAFGSDRSLYVADAGNHRIRRVAPDGTVTTIAGDGTPAVDGDGGPATAARVWRPDDIEVAAGGEIWFSDQGGLRVIGNDGRMRTVLPNVDGEWADGTPLARATGRPSQFVLAPDGVYYVDTRWDTRIRRIDACDVVSTVAGGGWLDGDAVVAEAEFQGLSGLSVDGRGNLFVSETGPYSDRVARHERVRRISRGGLVSTIAGGLTADYAGDGGPAAAARFSYPADVAADGAGRLLVADAENDRVRAIAGATEAGPWSTRPCWAPPPPPATTTTTTTTSSSSSTPPPPPPPPPPPRQGYWMVGRTGDVYAFGEAGWHGNAVAPGTSQLVDLERTPSGNGYWTVTDRGRVSVHGDARWFGGSPSLERGETVTSLSRNADGSGYWLFTTSGRVLTFGNVAHYGDMAGVRLNGPVLDSIPTSSGRGYYMVAADGGIFTFGDAGFRGSMGATRLNAPVQSLVPDGDGDGYWLVASDGGIFAFDAAFHGSMGDTRLNRPITGMVAFGSGGYLMVGEDGGIFTFGSAAFFGSLGDRPPAEPIVSVAVLS